MGTFHLWLLFTIFNNVHVKAFRLNCPESKGNFVTIWESDEKSMF